MGSDFYVLTILFYPAKAFPHGAPPSPLRSRPSLLRHCQRQPKTKKTFLNDGDYQAYLERLAKYRRKYDYTVHAYCLMPNQWLCGAPHK